MCKIRKADPSRILIRGIQCSNYFDKRAVHERLLYKKRSGIYYDELFAGIDSVLSDGSRYGWDCEIVSGILSVHLSGRNNPGGNHCKDPAIRKIPDTYQENADKQMVPQEKNAIAYALEMSYKRAEHFHVKGVLSGGMEVVMGMLFDLIPIVVAWGTVARIIAIYTPFFKWVSYPMGLYLQLFGVEEAFAVAPVTLVGFTDMFIPALLITGITSVKTKFIIGVLSLVQIIYLIEVGTIIVKSEIPLNLWKLFLIFMERMLIAIPLIVLFANLVL